MSKKDTKELRKEVAEYRKKALSFNEIARIMHITPQYAHYLTKPLKERQVSTEDKTLDKDS